MAEGNVGGKGVRAFNFKAGVGTPSRLLAMIEGTFCVGALVQANLGRREQLMVSGVPVGINWKRVAKREALGVARTSAIGVKSSGDLFIAFPRQLKIWSMAVSDGPRWRMKRTIHCLQQPVAATAPTRAPDQTNVYSEDELAKVTKRLSDLGYLE